MPLALSAAVFHARSELVLLPLTVTDRHGAAVMHVSREQITVLEEGRARPVVSLAREDAPVSVVFVVDASASMRHKMVRARAAVRTLMDTMNAGDEAALITFGDRPQIRCGFAQCEVADAVGSVPAEGETALIDGVMEGLRVARSGQNARKAVVVISDGGDNHSRYAEPQLREAVIESAAQLYTIAIHENTFSVRERMGSSLLAGLAEESGGAAVEIRQVSELPQAAEAMAAAMRSLYVAGFIPSPDGDIGRRRIRVRVQGRGLRVSARSVYEK